MNLKMLAWTVVFLGFAMALILFRGGGMFGSGAATLPAGARVFGVPGVHSPHGRLPELALDLVFDESRGRILARQDDGRVLAWETDSGKRSVIAETEGLFAFCPAANRRATAKDGAVIIAGSGGVQALTRGPFTHAAWSGDCQTLALAADAVAGVEIWSGVPLARRMAVETRLAVRNGIALSPDGRRLAAAEGRYRDGEGHRTVLELFAVDGDAPLRLAVLDAPETVLGLWRMAFTPDGRALAAGSQVAAQSGIRLIGEDGTAIWAQEGFAAYWVRAIAVSPAGDLVLTGDDKGWLRGWDRATGAKRFEHHLGLAIQSLAISGDGTRLAIGLWDGTIALVDLAALAR